MNSVPIGALEVLMNISAGLLELVKGNNQNAMRRRGMYSIMEPFMIGEIRCKYIRGYCRRHVLMNVNRLPE